MATRLNADDLPLEEGARLPEFVELGNKRLIDDKEYKKFATVENAARAFLRANAYPFPIAQAHFVPNKTLVTVMEKLNEFRLKYLELVTAFVGAYERHKEDMLAKHPEHREVLLPCYPAVDHIRSKFDFHIGMFEVAFPRQMREIDLASVQAEAAARTELQRKFETEWQRQYAQSMQEVDTFLKDAVVSMRGRVVDVFETIARKIKNREVVSATNLKTMSGIIDAFDGLDFMNDSHVKTRLEAVKGLISSGRDFKGDGDAIDALGNAVGAVLTVARETTDLDGLTNDYIRRIEV